jgi:hypothetical protein
VPRRLRRLGFGLATLLGAAPRGFFIPYRHAGACRPEGYPALAPLFAAAEPRMRAVLDDVAVLSDDLARVPECGPARFDQDWFPRLDAAAAYAVVRRARPRRIVEIGSGHSTRFLAAAVRDGGFTCEITCIDPTPRAGIAALGVRHVPQLLADASPEIFATLEAGDVLFVDSSHVAMPGTDVDRIALDLLPRLPAGVLIHLHDVFLPDPYPPEWAWRGYNEQLLAGALLQGGAYALVFASRYVATRRPEWLDVVADLPLPAGAFETSLWLRKR